MKKMTHREGRLKPAPASSAEVRPQPDPAGESRPEARRAVSEVVEAEGHLIDSQILNVVFDTVVKNNASFDVLRFDIGRSNDEPSSIAMRISAPSQQTLTQVLEELVALGCRLADQQDALVRETDRDSYVPDDFYSTTNHRTYVRLQGQ